jgi:glycosyltransferase involved in cell wall biosynthesis
VKREAEALEKNGYEIDLICLFAPGQPKTEQFGKITVHRFLKEVNQEKIYKYIFTSMLFFFYTFMKLQVLFAKRKYNIIQVHNMPEFHVYSAIIQKLKGIPVILDIHDLTPELFQSKWKKKKNKILVSLLVLAEKMSTAFADKVITVTEGCRRILIKRGVPGNKITVILNTPESKNFSFKIDRKFNQINENARILYHGTVAERFGIHVVVEAFKKFKSHVPGSIFNIYGRYDPSYRTYLERRIRELKLQDSIFLHPRVSLEEVQYIIADSDIGVVPYVSNLYMNLALSTKAFEYAAMGLPMVASPLQTLSLTFPGNSILYAKDRDPRDWSDKIHMLCMYPDLRENLANNALNIVSELSGDIMMENYVNLVEKTLKYEGNGFTQFASDSRLSKNFVNQKH